MKIKRKNQKLNIHYLDTVNTIMVLGCGGTGSWLIPQLLRYLKFTSQNSNKYVVLLCDADVVEEKNVGRQNFINIDVGKYKATVLAERYQKAYNIDFEIIPVCCYLETTTDFVEALNIPSFSKEQKLVLFDCVDNNSTRKVIHQLSDNKDMGDNAKIYLFSSSNKETFGEFMFTTYNTNTHIKNLINNIVNNSRYNCNIESNYIIFVKKMIFLYKNIKDIYTNINIVNEICTTVFNMKWSGISFIDSLYNSIFEGKDIKTNITDLYLFMFKIENFSNDYDLQFRYSIRDHNCSPSINITSELSFLSLISFGTIVVNLAKKVDIWNEEYPCYFEDINIKDKKTCHLSDPRRLFKTIMVVLDRRIYLDANTNLIYTYIDIIQNMLESLTDTQSKIILLTYLTSYIVSNSSRSNYSVTKYTIIDVLFLAIFRYINFSDHKLDTITLQYFLDICMNNISNIYCINTATDSNIIKYLSEYNHIKTFDNPNFDTNCFICRILQPDKNVYNFHNDIDIDLKHPLSNISIEVKDLVNSFTNIFQNIWDNNGISILNTNSNIVYLPKRFDYHPQAWLDNDQFASELSCADHAINNTQSMFINQIASNILMSAYVDWTKGKLDYLRILFDIHMNMHKEYITFDNYKTFKDMRQSPKDLALLEAKEIKHLKK